MSDHAAVSRDPTRPARARVPPLILTYERPVLRQPARVPQPLAARVPPVQRVLLPVPLVVALPSPLATLAQCL